jgi:penicillin-insensitive murein endopeptidase
MSRGPFSLYPSSTWPATFSAFLIFFCLSACAPVSVKESNPWAVVKKPLFLEPGKAEAIGAYSTGCLSGGQELPVSGAFWEFVNTSRNRYYAHPDAAAFLEKLGFFAFPYGKLLLGDISQPAGGPTSYGHASHQLGLDIDIRFGFGHGFFDSERRERYPLLAVAMHYMETKDGGFRLVNELTADWTPVYGALIRESALYPRTERIFVSPPIKKALCEQFRRPSGSGFVYPDWLRKVRPYYEHNAHFHVRLSCPDNNPRCERQKPSPPNPTDPSQVGCLGTELAWWFEADPAKPGYLKDSMDDYIKRGGAPAPSTTLDWQSKHDKLPAPCHDLLKRAEP